MFYIINFLKYSHMRSFHFNICGLQLISSASGDLAIDSVDESSIQQAKLVPMFKSGIQQSTSLTQIETPSETTAATLITQCDNRDPNHLQPGDSEIATGRMGHQEETRSVLTQKLTLLSIDRTFAHLEEPTKARRDFGSYITISGSKQEPAELVIDALTHSVTNADPSLVVVNQP
ncbi:hypothetical protein RF11_06583 [Thelohanellus kitauei]|uniref:Uncharacterized protein n=1 Tax=Thelohanellus kitauei TaxID=669202 RepID=A0A0C2ME89_THEKT|nr:hypothetical protein RF11_06583 [Thelohanellus kitauei]